MSLGIGHALLIENKELRSLARLNAKLNYVMEKFKIVSQPGSTLLAKIMINLLMECIAH